MLLETLDIKKNDVLIFSENTFDFANNFKIIDKHEEKKKILPIGFLEVEKYIQNSSPKNVILYRMLTNFPSFNPALLKYGIKILINESPEVMYYDPIYIIKDLEGLREVVDFGIFRFKIQQVGLTLSATKDYPNNYSEVYAFDLNSDEARNQNDKVYAEAIFVFEENVFASNLPEIDTQKTKSSRYKIIDTLEEETEEGDISEDIIDNKEAGEKPDNSKKQDVVISEFTYESEDFPRPATEPEKERLKEDTKIEIKPDEPTVTDKEVSQNLTVQDNNTDEISFVFSQDLESQPLDMKKILSEAYDSIPQKGFLDKLIQMQGPNNLLKKTTERKKDPLNELYKKEIIKSISENLNKQANIPSNQNEQSVTENESYKEDKHKSIAEFLKKQKESDPTMGGSDSGKINKSEVLDLFKSVKGTEYLNQRMQKSYIFKADQK